MLKTILICMSFVIILIGDAASGWERTYGTVDGERGYSVALTIDNCYVIAGSCPDIFHNGECFIIKANSSGDTVWTRKYGRDNKDETSRNITSTFDSCYVITGSINDTTGGSDDWDADLWVLKINNEGDSLWARRYGGHRTDAGYCVKQTPDSGYIVVGYTCSFGINCDIWLLKLDSNGDTLWTRLYGGSGVDDGYWIDITNDGCFIITGRTSSFGMGNSDLYLLKIDQYGDTIWTKTYGGWSWEWGRCVDQVTNNGYIITGQTSTFGSGNYNVYLIRTDEYGDSIWMKAFGGMEFDVGYSVIPTDDSCYIIAGATESYGLGDPPYSDVWLLKVNEYGDTIWTRTYGGLYLDVGRSIAQTPDGGYIIAGYTNSFGEGNDDVYLIKTDSEGYIVWIKEIPVKPENVTLNIYPNPFNSSCRIEAPIEAKIRIFDLTGREIAALSPGQQSWQPDNNVTSGVYLLKAGVGEKIITKKVVYLK